MTAKFVELVTLSAIVHAEIVIDNEAIRTDETFDLECTCCTMGEPETHFSRCLTRTPVRPIEQCARRHQKCDQILVRLPEHLG